ncbi:unnamed protein product, partial [Oikopleura dioica]
MLLNLRDLMEPLRRRIEDPQKQKNLILFIVSTALLLDNMLFMVIVPIITPILARGLDALNTYRKNEAKNMPCSLNMLFRKIWQPKKGSEDISIGILFASKAIVQLIANTVTGSFIDRIGYELPLLMGLSVMFVSTLLFAIFTSYGGLFFARSVQGLGSALADTAALGLVADRFTVDEERQRALGIALAFISFGSLVAPPFGGFFFQYFGHSVPFILLALMCLCDAFLIGMVAAKKAEDDVARENKPVGTPMWKLMSDPYIAIIAGALVVANIPLAFLEPTISKWMEDVMDATPFQKGFVWFPAFIPHVCGVMICVALANKYFRFQWFYGAVGLAFIAISTAFLPECRTYGQVTVPLGLMCFGIALVDTALLPTLAFIVDTRHASVYGSVYAIADISYSFAYALGPIVAGNIVEKFGFITLNLGMGAVSILYVPML